MNEAVPDESAPARNQRITKMLVEVGGAIGLESVTEYPIVGGRVDVVWLWNGPDQFPSRLPVVGFEVESSWRSRKHIKGDLHNLVELQPALGVIVLLGEGPDVDSVRRFAREMVERRVGRVQIWSEEDVLGLTSDPSHSTIENLLAESGVEGPQIEAESPQRIVHSGKYRALASWLAKQPASEVSITFSQIEEVLGFPLPASCRNHSAHWHSYDGSAVARAIIDAGWRARDVDIKSERLTFARD